MQMHDIIVGILGEAGLLLSQISIYKSLNLNNNIFKIKKISQIKYISFILTLIALIAALVMRIIFALEIGGFMSISEKS